LGLTPKAHVVLYEGDANNRQVIPLYWALKYWNFQKVSIIKGGLALWEKNSPVVNARKENKNTI
jgi:3-mercaptopyruvate sulfurtransferase SseA